MRQHSTYMILCVAIVGSAAHAMHDDVTTQPWHTLLEKTRTNPENNWCAIEAILTTHPDLHAPLFYTIIGPHIQFPTSALVILNKCIDYYAHDSTRLVPSTVAQQCDFFTQIHYLETMQKHVVSQLADNVMYRHGAVVKHSIKKSQEMTAFLQGISSKLEKLLMQSIENPEDAQLQEHRVWINDISNGEVQDKPQSSFSWATSLLAYLLPEQKDN